MYIGTQIYLAIFISTGALLLPLLLDLLLSLSLRTTAGQLAVELTVAVLSLSLFCELCTTRKREISFPCRPSNGSKKPFQDSG